MTSQDLCILRSGDLLMLSNDGEVAFVFEKFSMKFFAYMGAKRTWKNGDKFSKHIVISFPDLLLYEQNDQELERFFEVVSHCTEIKSC